MVRVVVPDFAPGPPAQPAPGECVVCFIERMVAHGCGNRLHFAGLWRDRAASRATALERRLGQKGGYCDCEVLLNAYWRRLEWEQYARGVDIEKRPDEPAPPARASPGLDPAVRMVDAGFPLWRWAATDAAEKSASPAEAAPGQNLAQRRQG